MDSISFRAADNLLLHCLDYGGRGRPPLLFLHGGSAHAHWWDFVAPAFTSDFHVMALDQRGHGDSPWTAEWAYGTRHYIADLHQIITAWEFGRPVLVGHSMGGHNVLVYAGTYGETVRAIAAIDSPATYPAFAKQALKEMSERPSRRFDSLEAAVAAFRTVPDDTVAAPEVMRQVAINSFRQQSDGKWIHKMDRRTMLREPIDAWPLLPRIQCPALYVRPASTPMPRDYGREIAARMTHGNFALVADSHHHVLLDNPKGLIAALKRFLSELRPSASLANSSDQLTEHRAMGKPASCFVAGTPRLHYLQWNPAARRTLLLLHGNSANAWWWRPMAEALSGADLRILALDLRGHGDSEWVRPPHYSPADYADDVARLITAAGAEGAIAVGHSMGGIAVLAFASTYHRLLRATAAIDIAITSGSRRNRYLRRLRTIPTISYPDLETAKARFRLMPNEGVIVPEVIAEIAEQSIRRTVDGGYTMKFDRESFFGSDGIDVGAAIAAIRIPLLLVRAERSRIMTAEAAANAHRSNPLVELVTIPNAHHHLPLEAPVLVARQIEQFAARHL